MLDVKKIRKDFPMFTHPDRSNLVFLDNASTTFKPQCVIDAIDQYYLEKNSNSHRGDYDLCFDMDQQVAKTRKEIANFVNCEINEVVFTAGTTMSLNLIAFGYGLRHLKKDDEIILSIAEHASNVLPWYRVCELTGAKVVFAPLTEDGRITPENVKKVISKKTKIVSLAHSGNVLGYVCDIKGIAKVAHENNAICVVDGAQSVPHIKTDFKDLDIDFLCFSAHKMCGPTGIGAMIGKYKLLEDMEPFQFGGGMNVNFKSSGEKSYLEPPAKFEAGTQNLSAIMGFGEAVRFINSIGVDNIHQHEIELKEYALNRLKDSKDIIIYNDKSQSGIITFNVKGVFAQDEATLLNSKGIAVRSGNHCAKMLEGYLKTNATCRVSTYLYTSKEDIDAFVDALLEGGDILDAYFK